VSFFINAPNKKIKSLTSFAGTHTRGLLRIIAHASAPLIYKLCSTMRIELQELKKEMIARGVNESIYAIDTLPSYEGFCIYDARSEIEVFYFERGYRFELQSFKDVKKAIACFKQMVFNEK